MKERNIALVMGGLPFAVAAVLVVSGDASGWWLAAIAVAWLLLASYMLRRGRHIPWLRAQQRRADGHAIVFWKPGCTYCERLLRAMRKDDRITWVNVWRDRAANTECRRHNNGDELTPTALVGDRVLRNPSAEELRAALD